MFGHEQTGQVVEVGVGVHRVKVGDIASIPFNIACGRCVNCKERKTNLCLTANPLKVRPEATTGAITRVRPATATDAWWCCVVAVWRLEAPTDMLTWADGAEVNRSTTWCRSLDYNCLVLPPTDENVMRNMLDLAMLSDSQSYWT